MTSLTDGVTSIGPHPATRTELEARAEGHTPLPWEITDGDSLYAVDETRQVNRFFAHIQGGFVNEQKEIRTSRKEIYANAALVFLAVHSYAPMKEALEAVLPFLTRNYPTSGHIDTICAALAAARGNTRKE